VWPEEIGEIQKWFQLLWGVFLQLNSGKPSYPRNFSVSLPPSLNPPKPSLIQTPKFFPQTFLFTCPPKFPLTRNFPSVHTKTPFKFPLSALSCVKFPFKEKFQMTFVLTW